MSKTTANIPFEAAASEWVARTGEERWIAAIYLPDAYDTCERCTARDEHEHPNKEIISREELEEAIEARLQDAYETLHDL